MATVLISIFQNQMEFDLVQKRKENYHHDHIPFILKGNGNRNFSVQVYNGLRGQCLSVSGGALKPFVNHGTVEGFKGALNRQMKKKSVWKRRKEFKTLFRCHNYIFFVHESFVVFSNSARLFSQLSIIRFLNSTHFQLIVCSLKCENHDKLT